MTAAEYVRMCGGVPLQAANAPAALDVLRAHQVDAVLSDMNMPGGDGLSLFERGAPWFTEREVVFVWLCTPTDERQRSGIRESGRRHFQKPARFAHVMNHVRDELAQRRRALKGSAPSNGFDRATA